MDEDEMYYAASALNESSEDEDTAMYLMPEEKENYNKNKKTNYKLLNKQKLEEM